MAQCEPPTIVTDQPVDNNLVTDVSMVTKPLPMDVVPFVNHYRDLDGKWKFHLYDNIHQLLNRDFLPRGIQVHV